MKCSCADWAANIEKVNGPLLLDAIRTGSAGYDGVKFRFCPWCGKALEREVKMVPLAVEDL